MQLPPPDQSDIADEPGMTKRTFLDQLVTGTLAATGLGSVYVALEFLRAPEAASGPETIELGPEGSLREGEAEVVAVGGTKVIVINAGGDVGLVAFSAVCTHLGCIVGWDTERQQIACPCHAAVFDTQGNVVSGPPPEPLPRFPVKVVQGTIVVGGA